MVALEVFHTYRRQKKNHRAQSLGCREHEESLPYHARSIHPEHTAQRAGAHYRDAIFIDHYDNVVAYAGYVS